MVISFTLLQFHKLCCDAVTNFSQQNCMGVHKYINIAYRILMEAFS